jgi:hypothetical protein
MDEEKRKRLEAAGWKVGDADEFLAWQGEAMYDDPLAAAKGIAFGCGISLVMLACIIVWMFA